jgi:hypothetical protein
MITLADRVVSTLVSLEVCTKLLHGGVAVLLGDYGFLIKYYGLVPLILK